MKLACLCALAWLCAATPALSQPAAPALLEQTRYRPSAATYDAFVAEARENFPGPFEEDAFRRDHPVADWDALRQGAGVEAVSIAYRVGGLRITGAIVRPNGREGQHPVLIWARGGVGRAQLDAPQLVEMAWWAQRGYVVVASNYRGAGGSEGADEFGGGDVDDLTALVGLAHGLEGVDRSRLYAIGFSRGAMMLYRGVAEGMAVRAFATAGGLSDLASLLRNRPDFAELFSRMMPDHEQERAGNFCRRSAACWPGRIAAPVLIAHGGEDRVVPSSQALALAGALEEANRPYELIVYGGLDHGLSGRRRDFFEQAHGFFRRAP